MSAIKVNPTSASAVLRETTIRLAGAAKMLPPGRNGRPVSVACLLRWVVDGVRTPGGIVRLEAVRLGSSWMTSVEALERFADAQTPRHGDRLAVPRSPAKVASASERAAAELKAAGF